MHVTAAESAEFDSCKRAVKEAHKTFNMKAKDDDDEDEMIFSTLTVAVRRERVEKPQSVKMKLKPNLFFAQTW